jgi:hypothetical protein
MLVLFHDSRGHSPLHILNAAQPMLPLPSLAHHDSQTRASLCRGVGLCHTGQTLAELDYVRPGLIVFGWVKTRASSAHSSLTIGKIIPQLFINREGELTYKYIVPMTGQGNGIYYLNLFILIPRSTTIADIQHKDNNGQTLYGPVIFRWGSS